MNELETVLYLCEVLLLGLTLIGVITVGVWMAKVIVIGYRTFSR